MSKDMEMNEIKDRISAIDAEIAFLQNEKIELERKQMEDPTLTFEEKFRVWFYGETKRENVWLREFGDKCPIAYGMLEESFHRYKTYDLVEKFQDILFFLDEEGTFEDAFCWNNITEEGIYALAKEMMEANIGSFKCDW